MRDQGSSCELEDGNGAGECGRAGAEQQKVQAEGCDPADWMSRIVRRSMERDDKNRAVSANAPKTSLARCVSTMLECQAPTMNQPP